MTQAVTPGSLWRVLKFTPTSVTKLYENLGSTVPDEFCGTVQAKNFPLHVWSTLEHSHETGTSFKVCDVKFYPGEMLLVAETVSCMSDPGAPSFVKVLMPRVAYVNIVHFKKDSLYLERVK